MEDDPYPDPLQFKVNIYQAPRAIFLGALAVFPGFPEKIQQYVREKWELIKVIRGSTENLKLWLVMIWFGSIYVTALEKMSKIKGGESNR